MNTTAPVPRRSARLVLLVTAGVVLCVGLPVAALVAGILIVARSYATNEAASAALAYASDCAPVVSVLGTNLTLAWGIDVELLDEVTAVRMAVRGSQGDGVLYVEMVPPYGRTDWRRIEIQADGLPPVVLDDAFCSGATATTAATP